MTCTHDPPLHYIVTTKNVLLRQQHFFVSSHYATFRHPTTTTPPSHSPKMEEESVNVLVVGAFQPEVGANHRLLKKPNTMFSYLGARPVSTCADTLVARWWRENERAMPTSASYRNALYLDEERGTLCTVVDDTDLTDVRPNNGFVVIIVNAGGCVCPLHRAHVTNAIERETGRLNAKSKKGNAQEAQEHRN
jgi:hypothetical protein